MSLRNTFRKWFSSRKTPIQKKRKPTNTKRRFLLENLEERVAPATHVWTGGGDGVHWSSGGNWDTGAPANGEGGDIIVQFNGGTSTTDDIPGLVVDQIHFTAGSNTISGSTTLGLSGNNFIHQIINDSGTNTLDSSLPISENAPSGDWIGVNVTAGETDINGNISGTGDIHLNPGTAGTLVLAGTNSYVGNFDVVEGTLKVTNSSALGDTGNTTTIESGALLQMDGGITVLQGLSLGGTLESVTGTNTWNNGQAVTTHVGSTGDSGAIDGDDATSDIGGAGNDTSTTPLPGTLNPGATLQADSGATLQMGIDLGGAGDLTAIGGGLVKLLGNDGYTGSTTIVDFSSTTLEVDGNVSGTASVGVGLGDTLSGTGIINGSATTTVGFVANIHPGDDPGILTTGSLDFTDGSAFNIEIGGNTPGNGSGFYSQDVVTAGPVTIENTVFGVALNLSSFGGYTPQPGDEYIVITNDNGSTNGTFVGGAGSDNPGAALPEGALVSSNFLGSGLNAYITYRGGDGDDIAIVVEGDVTTSTNGDLELRRIGNGSSSDVIQLLQGGTVIDSRPLSSVDSWTVNANDFIENSLNVNYMASGGFFSFPVTFNGWSAFPTISGQSLSIHGNNNGAEFTNETFTYTGAHDGNINLDGTVISFSSLTPVLAATGSPANIVFDMTQTGVANPDITIGDDGTVADPDATNDAGFSAISGSTFEYTEFSNPSESLTVDLGPNNDTINVETMDAGFNPTPFLFGPFSPFTINGGGLDTYNIHSTARAGGASYGSLAIVGSSTSTVNVGNAIDGVQDIVSDLYIENPPDENSITVDDSADTTGRTFTLSTSLPSFDPDHPIFGGNSSRYGQISNLAPGTINYEYADTSGITIQAGSGADTFQVDNSGGLSEVPITFHGNSGFDTLAIFGDPVSAGDAGVTQDTYTVGATPDAGTEVLDNGTQENITFDGLAPIINVTPAANFDMILTTGSDSATLQNGPAPGATFGSQTVELFPSNSTFEKVDFANKTTANIDGNNGGDEFIYDYTVQADGVTNLDAYGAGSATSGVGDAGDNDIFQVLATAADTIPTGLTNHLFGQDGNDDFTNFSTKDMTGIQSPVSIDGGTGTNDYGFSDEADAGPQTLTLTNDGVNYLLTSSGWANITYTNLASFYQEASAGDDTFDVLFTAAGTDYTLGGDGGSDEFTIGNTAANFDTQTYNGTLANILGPVRIYADFNNSAGGNDTLNVDSSGDAALPGSGGGNASITNVGSQSTPSLQNHLPEVLAAPTTRLANFATVNIDYAHGDITDVTFGGSFSNRMENVNVRASAGDDTIDVNDTTATVETTVEGMANPSVAFNGDVFHINGDNLSADNSFYGDDKAGLVVGFPNGFPIAGDDTFFLNIAGNIGDGAVYGPTTSLLINGGDQAETYAAFGERDKLIVNDNSGFSRNLNFAYLNKTGDFNIAPTFANTGLGGGTSDIPVQVQTVESVISNVKAGTNNDVVTVTGTPIDDQLTVAELPTTTPIGSGSGTQTDDPNLLPNGTQAGHSVTVFLDGQPYLKAPPVELTNINPGDHDWPGVAGGSSGPDLLINGIAPSNNLGGFFGVGTITLDGGGNSGTAGQGDQAIVYAASEGDLVDTSPFVATLDNPFGLGTGVLQAGFGNLNSYDTIDVDNGNSGFLLGADGVLVNNNANGFLVGIALASNTSFAQAGPALATQQPGLIVDGGDEAVPQPSGVSDNFNVTTTADYNIQVNGNLPGLTFNNGVPQGDQLNVAFSGSVNVFSDGASPPNVTMNGTGSGPFGVKFSSIERFNVTGTDGIVNIIGDNNTANNPQNDYFKVVGGPDPLGVPQPFLGGDPNGVGQFKLLIGGSWDPATGAVGNPDVDQNSFAGLSAPIYFYGIHRINAMGGPATSFNPDGSAIQDPDQTHNFGINALDISPWANNLPDNMDPFTGANRVGWGIETYWNQGNDFNHLASDGGLQNLDPDLLVINGVPNVTVGVDGVSENITVQPSAPQAGQVYDINAATGTSIAVINYVNNTNIIVNGSSGAFGDTDQLFLKGTNPANPSTSGNDLFDVDLTRAGTIGTEWVKVTDDNNGNPLYNIQSTSNINTYNIDTLGGIDTTSLIGADDGSVSFNIHSNSAGSVVNLLGTVDASDFFQLAYGPNGTEDALIARASAVPFTQTSVVISGVGQINVDGGGGTGSDSVGFFGTTNSDHITVNPTDALDGQVSFGGPVTFGYVNLGSTASTVILAGNPFNLNSGESDTVSFAGTGAADLYTYTPTSVDSGMLTLAVGGSSIEFDMFRIEGLSIDARNPTPPASPGDELDITTSFATVTPGSPVGSGTVQPVDSNGQDVLGLSYKNFETVKVTGGTALVVGTASDDTIDVSAAGIVTVTNKFGFLNTVDVSGFNRLVIDALGGNDTISVEASALFAGGIQVVGGDPGAGSDTVIANTDAINTSPTVDFNTNNVTGIVGGPISLVGVEDLIVNGLDNILNTFTVLGYGARTDVQNLTLNGGDTDNNDGDIIHVTTLSTVGSTLNYTPTSATSATITRVQGGPAVNITSFNDTLGDLTLANASGRFSVVNIIGSVGNDNINVIQTLAGDTRVTIPSPGRLPVDLLQGVGDGWRSLEVDGGLGDDSLTVDNSNGLVTLLGGGGGIFFDGGPGNNSLFLNGTTSVVTDTYTPGPGAGQGTDVEVDGNGAIQTVEFANLKPVFDSVVAANLTVNGTNASNAINYIEGNSAPNTLDPTWGQVSVDGFEAINFTNKTNLTINALAGNDTININNPNTPTALTGITVDGGDPTASDTLIANGTTGADTINYAPTGPDNGGITGAGPVPITYTTTEHVTINGQGGIDSLTVTTPNNGGDGTQVVFTPGATVNSGSFAMREISGGGNGILLTPMNYTNFDRRSTLTLATANVGRTDDLIFNGFGANDSFDIADNASNDGIFLSNANGNAAALDMTASGVFLLIANGVGANDDFAVHGPMAFDGVTLQAGGAAATAELFGDGSSRMTVDYANHGQSIDVTGDGFGIDGGVLLNNIAAANLDAGGAGVTVDGTAGPDTFAVTPTGTNSASAQAYAGGTAQNGQGGTLAAMTALGPALNFTTVSTAAGGFAIDGVGGVDQLFVEGTHGNDAININTATANAVAVNSLLVVNYNATLAHLEVDALAGNDTIDVTPSVNTSILVDGGDPIGSTPGDRIILHPIGAFSVEPGSHTDEGGLNDAGHQRISWVHIEAVTVVGGPGVGPPLVLGSNEDDIITIIARDASFNPACDGVQDFTVDLSDGPEILFINTPVIFVDMLEGNDQLQVHEPAPNNAVWNVQVYVSGGTPSSNVGGTGDLVELETPGTQNVVYSPDAPIPATAGASFPAQNPTDTAIIADSTNTSSVIATQFTITGFYVSSPGGVENFIYQGDGGNDNLTYRSPNNAAVGSTITYAPGSAADAGKITAQLNDGTALVPLTFQGLGQTGNAVTFTTAAATRADHLIVQDLGGAVGDVFNVTPGVAGGVGGGAVGQVAIAHAAPNSSAVTLNITTPGVSVLELQGLGGSDTTKITGLAAGQTLPYTNLLVNDGNTVNLTAAAGPVTVTLGDNTPGSANPDTVITGYGAPVTLIDVNTANLDATVHTLTAVGTTQDDNITYTPTGATAGTFYNDVPSGNNLVPNTVFNIANVSGNFLVFNDPAGNADQVTLRATAARDLIEIGQGTGIAQVFANNTTALLPVQLGISVEILNALGLGGQDTFQIIPAAGIGGQAQDNLLINVDGGAGGATNALVLGSSFGNAPGVLPATTFVVMNRGRTPDTGTLRVFQNAVANPDINYQNVQVVSPNVSSSVNGPQLSPNLLVMGPDNYEANEQQANSAFLGAGSTLQIQNADIFPNSTEFPGAPADQDWYRVVAQTTGTLDFQVYFRLFNPALLPAGGNLNAEVFDANGHLVGSATNSSLIFGVHNTAQDVLTAGDRIRIPAVAGQSYFLHIFGQRSVDSALSAVVNGYNVTVIDTAPPVPTSLELSHSVPNGEPNAPLTTQGTPDTGDLPPNAPPSDSGRSQFDDVTNGGFTTSIPLGPATLAKPTIYLRLDDAFFLNDLPGNQTPNNPPIGEVPIPFNASTSLASTTPGFRIGIFDGGNGAMSLAPGTPNNPSTGHTVDPNDSTFLGFAQPVPGVPHLYVLTIGSQGGATGNGVGALASDTLADGIHNITARVQIIDPSTPTVRGFGDRSAALKITIDTVPPPVMFGTDVATGLVSETGVRVEPDTVAFDLVTSNTRPSFQGLAEANSVVRLYVAITNPANPNFAAVPVFPTNFIDIGETVALPFDGTNAFPNGQWTLQTTVDLNDPRFFALPGDGLRTLVVTAEDLAGNVSGPAAGSTTFPAGQVLQIFIDTQGPQVTDVRISNPQTGDENFNFNLFANKVNLQNQDQGPTPLVYAITINIQDLPPRVLPFLNLLAFKPEVAATPGGIFVTGDQVGIVAISQVVVVEDPNVAGQPATGTVQLIFAKPLEDDRYTLHIFDTAIVDPAGNKLDGESNASEPLDVPTFPSGNGIPGGDFFARFTVNSRPSVGLYGNTQANLDINGNGYWDPVNFKDATNDDLAFQFGAFTDASFSGNFSATGTDANGFAKLAAYGQVNGKYRWLLSLSNVAGSQNTPAGFGNNLPGTADISVVSGLQINGSPLAYHFNPNINADEIALFDGNGNWYIDFNHHNNLDGSALGITDGLRGHPIVGDFDGDGKFDLATYQPDTNTFQFDLGANGYGSVDATIKWGFPGVSERPVAADMNADGITDIGLAVPRTIDPGQAPTMDWYFLESPGPVALENAILNGIKPGVALGVVGTVNALNHGFNDSPFHQDQFLTLGNGFYQPIVGLWDPPAPKGANAPTVNMLPGTFTDVAATATLKSVGQGGYAGLITRVSANGKNEYWGGISHNGNSYSAEIRLLQNGTWHTLTSQTLASKNLTFAYGSTLEFDTVGTALNLYYQGHLVASINDNTLKSAGGVGTAATPGSGLMSAHASAVTRQAASLPYSYDFNQPGVSLLGTSWDQWQGNFSDQGNVLAGLGNTNIATLYLGTQTQANVSVSADVTGLPPTGMAALISRYQANGDMYRAGLVKRNGHVYAEIWVKKGSTWTKIGSSKGIVPATGTLKFETVGSVQELYVNGVLVASAHDTRIKGAGTVGLFGAKSARFDNFAASVVIPTFVDDFSQPHLSGAWNQLPGSTFSTVGGILTSQASVNIAVLNGMSQANTSVSIGVTSLTFGGTAGLVSRYTANGNMYRGDVTFQNGSLFLEIWKHTGGHWTRLNFKKLGSTWSPGTLTFQTFGTTSLLTYNLGNGAVYNLSVNDSSITGPGSVGVYGSANSVFDNFTATSM